MIRIGFMRALLTVSLVTTIPASVAAQDGAPGPEGERWDLIAYGVDGLAPVPWNIDATLLLEGGSASGSTGCERFSGDYELVAAGLSFADAFDVTRETCVGDAAAVEAGYLAALPQVVTWTIVDEELQLADATDSVILVYAQPVVGLTANDVAGLVAVLDNQGADLERLDQRLDAIRIGTLRDRINALEAQVASLMASAAAPSKKSASAFSAAEKVLLAAIPAGIRKTCMSRRDQNPSGTVAAVQCKPETAKVRDMAYYLLPGGQSWKVWQERMDAYGVKYRDRACSNGKQGFVLFTGGIQAAGCYVNEDGRANLRYLDQPWKDCSALKIGGTRVKDPVMYIAVLGPDDDLATLTKWAEPREDARPKALYKRVESVAGCVPRAPM
jgi:heat shock protein HslJ